MHRWGSAIDLPYLRRQVEAIAVTGGRIVAAGSEAEVMKTRTDATEVVDLPGKTPMPSFIDAHGHFMNAPQIVNWTNVSAHTSRAGDPSDRVFEALVERDRPSS